MTYNEGDIVVVVDPKPFLDDRNYTDNLYFNDKRMSVFIGREFIISKRWNKNIYKLRYIDEYDCLETESDRIEEWMWNEKWLIPADIDYNNLQDIMLMITW